MIKKNEVVTVEILDQAVDAILTGMDRMFTEQGKKWEKKYAALETEIHELKSGTKKGFEKLEDSFEDYDLNTVSRREFEALKSKVNKLALQ